MEDHPGNCYCADCVPNWPVTREEEEQQRQQELAEQFETIAPTPLPAKD